MTKPKREFIMNDYNAVSQCACGMGAGDASGYCFRCRPGSFWYEVNDVLEEMDHDREENMAGRLQLCFRSTRQHLRKY